MGAALAAAVIEAGHEAVVVSGPVDITYPQQAEIVTVQSTEDMLEACLKIFPACDGLIAAAAPCDYRPVTVARHKIRKTGDSLKLQLVETPDVVALLGAGQKYAMDGRFRPGNRGSAHEGHAKTRTKKLRPDSG